MLRGRRLSSAPELFFHAAEEAPTARAGRFPAAKTHRPMNKLTLLLLLPWLAVATAAASPQPPADSTALADERRETALMRELHRESECLPEEGDLVWRARFEGTDSVRTAGELYRKIHTILHDTWRSPGSEELLTEDEERLHARMLFTHTASNQRFGYRFECRVRMLREEAAAEVELRCTEVQFNNEVKRPAECFPFRDDAGVPFAVKKREFAQLLQLESALRTLRQGLRFELAGGL